MITTSPSANEVGTVSVAEICSEFGQALHAEFKGHPEWIAAHIAPMSVESFEKFTIDPLRVERMPLGLIVRAIRRVERRRGIAAAQSLWDLLTRPVSGLVTTPVEDRARNTNNIEREMVEAQVATSRLYVTINDARADGHVDDKEQRRIAELARDAQNEIADLAEVVR